MDIGEWLCECEDAPHWSHRHYERLLRRIIEMEDKLSADISVLQNDLNQFVTNVQTALSDLANAVNQLAQAPVSPDLQPLIDQVTQANAAVVGALSSLPASVTQTAAGGVTPTAPAPTTSTPPNVTTQPSGTAPAPAPAVPDTGVAQPPSPDPTIAPAPGGAAPGQDPNANPPATP